MKRSHLWQRVCYDRVTAQREYKEREGGKNKNFCIILSIQAGNGYMCDLGKIICTARSFRDIVGVNVLNLKKKHSASLIQSAFNNSVSMRKKGSLNIPCPYKDARALRADNAVNWHNSLTV